MNRTEASSETAPTELREIVEGILDGDDSAARRLFDRYRDSVMGYCMLRTDGDRDRAKDLAQESFATAFEKLDQLRDPENFTSWFWTIVRRTCADHGSRRSRHAEVLDLFALNRDVVLGAEDKLARERRIECVHEILEQVDDDQLRAIVEMKYTEPEHTTREIADELDIPHGTVTVKLMRFRESIEEDLVEQLASVDETLPTRRESR